MSNLHLCVFAFPGPIPDLRQTALNNAAFYDNRFDGELRIARRYDQALGLFDFLVGVSISNSQ